MATVRGSQSVVIVFVLCWSLVAAGQEFAGGTGVSGDPYRIATAEQLLRIGADPNLLEKHFVLIADIDLSDYSFEQAPIAPAADPCAPFFGGDPFAGVLAGNGHVIRHLHVEGESFLGLFGGLADGAVVSDLGVEDVSVQGEYCLGGLAGYSEGSVSNCYSTGQIAGDFDVGGLIGENYGWWRVLDSHSYGWGHVSDCYSAAKVRGISDSIGGLVGHNSGSVWNCHSTGQVAGGLYRTGGLVGGNVGGIISNCYSTGAVTGRESVGGLVGYSGEGMVSGCYSSGPAMGTSKGVVIDGVLKGASRGIGGLIGETRDGNVSNCFSTGAVEGVYWIGGLIGVADEDSVSHCYSLGTVTGEGFSGGLIGDGTIDWVSVFWNMETSGLTKSDGGTGLTTAEMQNMETYLEAGWDFVGESANGTAETWQMPPEGGYPRLSFLAGYEPVLPQGQGTLADPFLITNAVEFGSVGHRPMASYRLAGDLDLSDITWTVPPVPWFDGHFDGNGCVIGHLQIEGDKFLGLFGYLGSDASVSKLGLEHISIQDRAEVAGSLAAVNRGILAACYCIGSVSDLDFVGRLVGHNYGNVSNCYAIGRTAPIVRGRSQDHLQDHLIERNDGAVSTCYWRGAFSGELWDVGGAVEDVTTAQMQDIDTYLEAGWDFVGETDDGMEDIWTICPGQDSPHLWWEDIVCDE
jgi:The GLUG motif